MKEVAARGVRVPNTPWIRQWTRMSLQDVMDCPPDSKKERMQHEVILSYHAAERVHKKINSNCKYHLTPRHQENSPVWSPKSQLNQMPHQLDTNYL